MNIKTTVEITDQQIEDLFVTALEGGSNYWYYLPHLEVLEGKYAHKTADQLPCLSEALPRLVLSDSSIQIPVHDIEDNTKLGIISYATIERGLQLMAEKYHEHFADVVNETGDANTADVFLQLVVMGEIVYG